MQQRHTWQTPVLIIRACYDERSYQSLLPQPQACLVSQPQARVVVHDPACPPLPPNRSAVPEEDLVVHNPACPPLPPGRSASTALATPCPCPATLELLPSSWECFAPWSWISIRPEKRWSVGGSPVSSRHFRQQAHLFRALSRLRRRRCCRPERLRRRPEPLHGSAEQEPRLSLQRLRHLRPSPRRRRQPARLTLSSNSHEAEHR